MTSDTRSIRPPVGEIPVEQALDRTDFWLVVLNEPQPRGVGEGGIVTAAGNGVVPRESAASLAGRQPSGEGRAPSAKHRRPLCGQPMKARVAFARTSLEDWHLGSSRNEIRRNPDVREASAKEARWIRRNVLMEKYQQALLRESIQEARQMRMVPSDLDDRATRYQFSGGVGIRGGSVEAHAVVRVGPGHGIPEESDEAYVRIRRPETQRYRRNVEVRRRAVAGPPANEVAGKSPSVPGIATVVVCTEVVRLLVSWHRDTRMGRHLDVEPGGARLAGADDGEVRESGGRDGHVGIRLAEPQEGWRDSGPGCHAECGYSRLQTSGFVVWSPGVTMPWRGAPPKRTGRRS